MAIVSRAAPHAIPLRCSGPCPQLQFVACLGSDFWPVCPVRPGASLAARRARRQDLARPSPSCFSAPLPVRWQSPVNCAKAACELISCGAPTALPFLFHLALPSREKKSDTCLSNSLCQQMQEYFASSQLPAATSLNLLLNSKRIVRPFVFPFCPQSLIRSRRM